MQTLFCSASCLFSQSKWIRLTSVAAWQALRKSIAEVFYKNELVKDTEVFISDGAQGDITRLQLIYPSAIIFAGCLF